MGEIWLDRGDLAARRAAVPTRARARSVSRGGKERARRDRASSEAMPPTAERLISEAIATKPDAPARPLQPRAARRATRRRPDGRARVRRGTEAAPRELQGRLQPVAALRAGRRSRRTDRRAEAVDREQSRLRGGTLLPGQGVSRFRGRNLDEAIALAQKGLELAPTIGVRAARPLRAGGRLQPAGPRARSSAGTGAWPRAGSAGQTQ